MIVMKKRLAVVATMILNACGGSLVGSPGLPPEDAAPSIEEAAPEPSTAKDSGAPAPPPDAHATPDTGERPRLDLDSGSVAVEAAADASGDVQPKTYRVFCFVGDAGASGITYECDGNTPTSILYSDDDGGSRLCSETAASDAPCASRAACIVYLGGGTVASGVCCDLAGVGAGPYTCP